MARESVALNASTISQRMWGAGFYFARDFVQASDVTALLQAQLDDIFALGGGTLIVPAGAFYLSSEVQIPLGVRLLGTGRSTATSATTWGTRWRMTHTGRAFRLSGNWARLEQCVISYGAVVAAADEAIYAVNVADVSVENVYIVEAFNGITLLACNTPVLAHISLANTKGSYGIKVFGDLTNGNSDSHLLLDVSSGFTSAAPAGFKHFIAGNYCNSGKVIGYRFVQGDYGVVVEGTTDDPDDLWFEAGGCDNQTLNGYRFTSGQNIFLTDAWCGQAGDNGIVLDSSFTGNMVASGLRIRGSGKHGLRIEGGRNIHITNPLIGQNGTLTNNVYSGISVGAATRLTVVGGTCGELAAGGTNQQKDGIDFNDATIDYAAVVGVNLKGNVTRGFTTSAATRDIHVTACPGIKQTDGYLQYHQFPAAVVSNVLHDVAIIPTGNKIIITDLARKLASGTCDVAIWVDGVSASGTVGVTSAAANTALGSPVTVDATSASKTVQVNVTNVSSAVALAVTLGYKRLAANA